MKATATVTMSTSPKQHGSKGAATQTDIERALAFEPDDVFDTRPDRQSINLHKTETQASFILRAQEANYLYWEMAADWEDLHGDGRWFPSIYMQTLGLSDPLELFDIDEDGVVAAALAEAAAAQPQPQPTQWPQPQPMQWPQPWPMQWPQPWPARQPTHVQVLWSAPRNAYKTNPFSPWLPSRYIAPPDTTAERFDEWTLRATQGPGAMEWPHAVRIWDDEVHKQLARGL